MPSSSRNVPMPPGANWRPEAAAKAAWLACAVLAHNLTRWTARLGAIHPDDQLTVARTIRARALPARLVNRSGRRVLRLPARWPWATTFTRARDPLRALPPVPI